MFRGFAAINSDVQKLPIYFWAHVQIPVDWQLTVSGIRSLVSLLIFLCGGSIQNQAHHRRFNDLVKNFNF